MPVLSKYAKERTVRLKQTGLINRAVVEALKHERINITVQTVQRLYKRYCETGSTTRRKGSGRSTLLSAYVLQTIEGMMTKQLLLRCTLMLDAEGRANLSYYNLAWPP